MKRLVLDSNIVLLDANNILTLGKDAVIVLPEIVLKEVDNKKSGFNELAYQARQMGRILATFDVEYTSKHHSGLIITTLCNTAARVTVEVVSLDKYIDIDPKDSGANDQKIVQIAQKMQELHGDVMFITNDVALIDTKGFNVMNGVSIFPHYTNKKSKLSEEENFARLNNFTNAIKSFSMINGDVIAIPEEDAIYINDSNIEVLGNRTFYYSYLLAIVRYYRSTFSKSDTV